jgi:hypothetical protein
MHMLKELKGKEVANLLVNQVNTEWEISPIVLDWSV